MLPRTPEPEVMDDLVEAREYDRMDHSSVNSAFVDDLLDCVGDRRLSRVLDVGVGTALIPIELAKRNRCDTVIAIDRSEAMLAVASRHVREWSQIAFENHAKKTSILLTAADARELPFESQSLDAVVSNSLVHHLPGNENDRFAAIETALSEMWRVVAARGVLLVRDLMRPTSASDVEQIVERYAAEETAIAKQLFRQSLHAALSVEEIRKIVNAVGIPPSAVTATSDRHWTIAYQIPS